MSYASDSEILKRFQNAQALIEQGKYRTVDTSDIQKVLDERKQQQAPPPVTDPAANAGSSISPSFLLAGLGAVAVLVTKKKKN